MTMYTLFEKSLETEIIENRKMILGMIEVLCNDIHRLENLNAFILVEQMYLRQNPNRPQRMALLEKAQAMRDVLKIKLDIQDNQTPLPPQR